ncbi:MAG: GspE/PulE/PilB domain-containing protein, partial [Planctomycetota bacterium]
MIQFARKLKGIIEKAGMVDAATADALLLEAQRERRPLTEVIVKKGLASENDLLALVGKAANTPPIDLDKLRTNPEALEDVPVDIAKEYMIFPIDKIGSIITIAVANPFDVLKLDDIRIIT